jgi:hypothetical protein
MEKKFTKIEIAVIKRTAQNVSQFVNKKAKIDAKIAELESEKAMLQPIIESFQGPIREMTGGYTTEDLVNREVVHTGKIDSKTGKEIMQTRFVLKYPETVIPPVAADEEVKEAEDIPTEAVEEQAEAQMQAENNVDDFFA